MIRFAGIDRHRIATRRLEAVVARDESEDDHSEELEGVSLDRDAAAEAILESPPTTWGGMIALLNYARDVEIGVGWPHGAVDTGQQGPLEDRDWVVRCFDVLARQVATLFMAPTAVPVSVGNDAGTDEELVSLCKRWIDQDAAWLAAEKRWQEVEAAAIASVPVPDVLRWREDDADRYGFDPSPRSRWTEREVRTLALKGLNVTGRGREIWDAYGAYDATIERACDEAGVDQLKAAAVALCRGEEPESLIRKIASKHAHGNAGLVAKLAILRHLNEASLEELLEAKGPTAEDFVIASILRDASEFAARLDSGNPADDPAFGAIRRWESARAVVEAMMLAPAEFDGYEEAFTKAMEAQEAAAWLMVAEEGIPTSLAGARALASFAAERMERDEHDGVPGHGLDRDWAEDAFRAIAKALGISPPIQQGETERKPPEAAPALDDRNLLALLVERAAILRRVFAPGAGDRSDDHPDIRRLNELDDRLVDLAREPGITTARGAREALALVLERERDGLASEDLDVALIEAVHRWLGAAGGATGNRRPAAA